METRRVDVAIIGAGTAGLNARRAALKHGAKDVVLIEDGPYGTTCARVGCMPSKLLIRAAEAAHEIRHARALGIDPGGEPRIDVAAVFGRVREERDRFAGFVVRSVEEHPPEQRLRGHARFLGPTRLAVGEDTIVEARAVVIATGSSTWYPGLLREAGDALLTSDDVFELEALPRTLAVIGAGIIGLELGQALHRLGVDVTFVSLEPQVGPLSDPVVREKAAAILGAEMPMYLRSGVAAISREDGGVRLAWKDADGAEHEGRFERVLAATGRKPNVVGLGLEATGLALDRMGVPLHDPETGQCGDAPIFLAGDAANDRPLLHEASDEGRMAGANAATFPELRRHARRTPLGIVFSDPQIAMVGKSFAALQREGAPFAVGEVSWDDQGRARVMLANHGHLRIYGEPGTGRLLGAEMIGPRAENIAHLLAWAVQQGMTASEALKMPFYHPVLEEGLRTALYDLAAKA